MLKATTRLQEVDMAPPPSRPGSLFLYYMLADGRRARCGCRTDGHRWPRPP